MSDLGTSLLVRRREAIVRAYVFRCLNSSLHLPWAFGFNSNHTKGAILRYDIGKWKDDEFHTEPHSNKPLMILSEAIELLQSDHDFGEGKIPQYLEKVAIKSTKLPALRDYRFPGRDQDRLFN